MPLLALGVILSRARMERHTTSGLYAPEHANIMYKVIMPNTVIVLYLCIKHNVQYTILSTIKYAQIESIIQTHTGSVCLIRLRVQSSWAVIRINSTATSILSDTSKSGNKDRLQVNCIYLYV